MTQAGEIAADAWVPVSVVDAEGTSGDDFRTVGDSYWSVSKDDYEANCEEARKLLAEAGYENGVGFPRPPTCTTPTTSTRPWPRPSSPCGRTSWALRSL
ncbi:MAG: hypothetical protein ACLRWQ_23530 [Flavonifractor plautii]